MRTFISYILGAATLVAFFFFVFTLHGVFASPVAGSQDVGIPVTRIVPMGVESIPAFAPPVRLHIPAIAVNAKVQKVGVTAKNTIGIPSNFTDVAWYKYGAVPGEQGSAIIDGHVDNALALPGVFKNLHNVKVGDDIYVDDAEGTTLHFKVTDVSSYDYKNTPASLLTENDKKLLRLITCGGKWVRSDKTYDTRLVVTAEFVSKV
jgi:LPXTG-site transpeptidase (sortase) family protein